MSNLKSTVIRCAGPLGGYGFSRWLTRETPKILMYHRFSKQPQPGCVDAALFDRQISYMKRRFNVVPLEQVLSALREGRTVPRNAAVISVDDGYLDFYTVAWPVLKRHGVPATLFIATRFPDGDFWMWPDRVRYILTVAGEILLADLPGFPQDSRLQPDKNERDRLWGRIIAHLLSIDEDCKLAWIEAFARRNGVEVPAQPISGCRAISWQQVREMAADDIEIGAHTRTHPSLGMIAPERLADEIAGSMDDIEQHTGRRPRSFCYPNGQPADYSTNVKAQVEAAGCRGAVTAFYDRDVLLDAFEVRRFTASENWFQFEKSVNGVELLSARWLNQSNKNMDRH